MHSNFRSFDVDVGRRTPMSQCGDECVVRVSTVNRQEQLTELLILKSVGMTSRLMTELLYAGGLHRCTDCTDASRAAR